MNEHPTPQRFVPSQSVSIELTAHCVERFNEHFRPCLDASRAEAELQDLLEHQGSITYSRPSWVRPLGPHDSSVGYVEIGDVMALPLVPHRREHGVLVATTCLARGCITHAERDRRRRRRAKAQRQRRRP